MKITRTILSKLIDEIDKPYISILIGPRQVGKSFLLRELSGVCEKRKLTASYYNLEDPDHLRLFSAEDSEVLRIFKNAGRVVFIDEFHYLKNATKLFKILYDSKTPCKIFASGSSSIEIHKHLKESLSGRYRLTEIYPCFYKREMAQIKGYTFDDFFATGGMPGIIHEKTHGDRIDLLKNIVQTYLMKDIKSLIKEENIRAFNSLLYLIAQNQGSTISVASLAREVRLSEPAVNHHLEIMAQTFTCIPLESYSGNIGNELKKVKKYYLFDLGIRNSLLKDFSKPDDRPDKGVLAESFVFLNIIQQLQPNMEIKYWRTRQGDEVDFILLKNRIPMPVEVKYSAKNLDVPEGMKKFLHRYKNAPGGIVYSLNKKSGYTIFDDRRIDFFKLDQSEEIEYLKPQ